MLLRNLVWYKFKTYSVLTDIYILWCTDFPNVKIPIDAVMGDLQEVWVGGVMLFVGSFYFTGVVVDA